MRQANTYEELRDGDGEYCGMADGPKSSSLLDGWQRMR